MKILLPFFFMCLLFATPFNATSQQIINGKGYTFTAPLGWIQSEALPQGIDVGFTKQLSQGVNASFNFHFEVMPPEAGDPPSNTSDMKQQWDAMVEKQYPDVRSVDGAIPKIDGRILVNGLYEFTENANQLRRRYTYFLSGRTAFVVQCSSPPDQWSVVSADFDAMISSLHAGSGSLKPASKSDESVSAELKRNVPTLLGSFQPQWKCSFSKALITSESAPFKRTCEIALLFDRADIGAIYKATSIVFGMMKDGKSDADLDNLPAATQTAASNSGAFIKYVGQVWGLAYGYAVNCNPAIDGFKLTICNSNGHKVGAVSISRDNGSAILTGKVTSSDAQAVASMYVFE